MCGTEVARYGEAEVESWGVETVALAPGADGALEPLEVAQSLLSRGAQTVLLEGGATLAGSWWSAGLIDKLAAFVCPLGRFRHAESGRYVRRGPAAHAGRIATA